MSKRTPSGDYLVKLIAKFPDAPALTLAKIAYKEHPQLWPTLESCRTAVRHYLGVKGKSSRKFDAAHLHREPRKPGWTGVIPEALVHMGEWKPLEVKGPHRALILADIHIPFHDPAALEVALEYGLKKKPTIVILNGDIADHYGCSEFLKDPKLRNFPGEVKAVRQFLAGIRKRFSKARIIYKHGNHEERYERYLRIKAPELLGIPDFEWAGVFGLEEYRVELVDRARRIAFGKLNVVHGHEYRFQISNPVNPARGLFQRGKVHALCGHFHQRSNHSEKNMEGKVVSTWSTGALCDLHPEYRPFNNWNHGFAWVEIGKDGSFQVDNHLILDGEIW